MKTLFLLITFTFLVTANSTAQDNTLLPFSQKPITDSSAVKTEIDKIVFTYRKLSSSNRLNFKTVYIDDFYGIVSSLHKKPVHVYYYQEQFTNWGIYDCYYDENSILRLIVQNFYKNGQHTSYYVYYTAETTPTTWIFKEAGTYEEDSTGIVHHAGEKLPAEKRYSFVEKTTGQPTLSIDLEAVLHNSKQFYSKSNELEVSRTGTYNFRIEMNDKVWGIMKLEIAADNKIKGQYTTKADNKISNIEGVLIEERFMLTEKDVNNKVINTVNAYFNSKLEAAGTLNGKLSGTIYLKTIEAYNFDAALVK
jgi:hypothetical protein